MSTNRTSTVYDTEWGCQSQPPAGGIDRTSNGVSFGDNALLSTRSEESGLDIDVDLTGTNTAQPMGAKGTYIGRAWIYGLGAMGQEGVKTALEVIHRELDTTMALCGETSIEGLGRHNLLIPEGFEGRWQD